ncbi:hypothetical protein WP12_04005 [Sphingomonas sp. SRS2]|nr:hypothetical protein WP12_04005 [Sphingomonas sp. SRS2]
MTFLRNREERGGKGPSDLEIMTVVGGLTEAAVRIMLADLSDARRIRISRRGEQRSIEVFPDRSDDSDEISRRIQAQKAERVGRPMLAEEIARKPQISAPKPSESTPKRLDPILAANTASSERVRHGPARGSMPSIEWVQIDRLLVDDSYQRSIETGPSRALIRRIATEWDWRLCVPLMVSRRPDGLYVIDGQHRRAAAGMRNDIPQLPCCVSTYGGPADEAAMFVAANRARRAINRLDDFHAAQAGGDEDAIAVAALITRVGFSVSRRTGSASWAPGEVAFTSAITKVRKRHGEFTAERALAMMAEAFSGQRLVAGSSVFTAICAVLVSPPPDFDSERLMRALTTFDMEGWSSFLTKSRGGTDRNRHLREMLLEAYADVTREEAA